MNILFLANHFNAGGISSYILNLAQGLTARGHSVCVGSSGGEWIGRLGKLKARHIYLPLDTKSIISPKLIRAYFALKRAIRQERIDIIHAQTRVSAVAAWWACRKTGVPFIWTAHGFFRRRWGRMLFPCWGKFVIAISEAVEGHLIKDLGLNEERIRLVHNGIDTTGDGGRGTGDGLQDARGGRKEIRKKFGLSDGPVVGIIARLSEVKGHRYLITAMKKVIEQVPGAQLLSVGDGKIKNDLEALADSLNIREKIHFVPSVSDTREPLSVMDVFVMPSLQEGLGLSIMEAMLAQAAVVASSVGGIPSLVKDNETGILVKARDPDAIACAIIGLLNDKARAARLSARARELILREFSLERMAQETERAYKECLNR